MRKQKEFKSKGEETRDKIIHSSIHLFAKKGLHWVSFQEIAQEVGVAQPTIYKYFVDKDDVLLNCLNRVVISGRQLIDQCVDPYKSSEEQIYGYIYGNFLWVSKHPDEALILLSTYYFAFNHKNIASRLAEINSQSIERLEVRLAAGEREGAWPSSDRNLLARIIHSLIIGEMFKQLHEPESISPKKRVEQVMNEIKKILKCESIPL